MILLHYLSQFWTNAMQSFSNSWPPPEIFQTGLRQKELCDFLGLNYRAEALNAKLTGLSTHDYIQQLTGWKLHNEHYYPAEYEFDNEANEG